MVSSFKRLLLVDYTKRRTTVGRTPPDEWSALRRDLYTRTQHTQQRDIHAPAGFEPTISASERPQTYALHRAATEIGWRYIRHTYCSMRSIVAISSSWKSLKRSKRFSSQKTIITYLLTPWCRVLLEKLTGLQLVKKFPAFHATRRFITALTSVLHLSLSWANPIQSIYPHSTSWRSILILSTHLRLVLPSGSFPPVSSARPCTPTSPHPYAPHAQPISFFSILSPAQYWVRSTNYLAPRYAISSIPPLPRPSYY